MIVISQDVHDQAEKGVKPQKRSPKQWLLKYFLEGELCYTVSLNIVR